MKQMDYNGNGKSEVLYYYSDGGFGVAVVNVRGCHPCGYVTFPGIETIKDYENVYPWHENSNDKCIGPHYGFTFLGTMKHLGLEERWIGWDYGHIDDYVQHGPIESDANWYDDGKKWTTEEVVNEAYDILRFIKNGWFVIDEES